MRTLICAAAIVLTPAAALAANDVMAGYYGNTVVSHSGLGESVIHYRADHKFDGSGSNSMGSMALTGTWVIDAKGELCRTYDTPPPGVDNPSCMPVASHKPGDSWTYDAGGETVTVTLQAGER